MSGSDGLNYWKKKLVDFSEPPYLAADFERANAGFNFQFTRVSLTPQLWASLRAVAARYGASPQALGLSAFLVLMHRFSGVEDVCVGSPAGREVFVVRSAYSDGTPFEEFLKRTGSTLAEAQAQPVALSALTAALGLSETVGSPFQSLYAFLSSDAAAPAPSTGDTELVLQVSEGPHGADLSLRYNADLFEGETAQRILGSYVTLLNEIALNPSQAIGQLRLLSREAESRLLGDLSGSTKDYPTCSGIQQYFERWADSTPEQIAVEYERGNLTYKELEARANQLAHFLRAKGVTRNTFVGLLMERSIELIVSIMGVLKAGGAYVPIDPEYPDERIDHLLKDIEAKAILTLDHLSPKLEVHRNSFPIVSLDTDWNRWIAGQPQSRAQCENQPSDIAYMIYTSGSTGTPKGCPNTHRGIGNCIHALLDQMPPTAKPLHKSPFTFDTSVPEIFIPLFSGATMVLARPHGHKDVSYLATLIQERSVTELKFVPSMLQAFLEEPGSTRCESLRRVVSAGEALPLKLVKKFYGLFPKAELVNLYGPTEAAVDVTYWKCDPKDTRIPIGYPLPNNRIYILDGYKRPVPVGVWGDLFIGGVQVARGYWKRPELQNERFVHDPFTGEAEARMYKTGDRARFVGKGEIEFQGRSDFQVKVRGFRVELGEIEAVLLEHGAVQQAAVVLKKLHGEDAPGSLVAYVVPKDPGASPSFDDLSAYLKGKIPEYMVPSGFVTLEKLPQSSHGKIDRKDLMARKDEFVGAKVFAAPKDEIEQVVLQIWEKALNVTPISTTDNYFALGGDSLSLIRIQHQLKARKWSIEMGDLYSHQTIAALGDFIRSKFGSVAANAGDGKKAA